MMNKILLSVFSLTLVYIPVCAQVPAFCARETETFSASFELDFSNLTIHNVKIDIFGTTVRDDKVTKETMVKIAALEKEKDKAKLRAAQKGRDLKARIAQKRQEQKKLQNEELEK